jgi:hypothetical protein
LAGGEGMEGVRGGEEVRGSLQTIGTQKGGGELHHQIIYLNYLIKKRMKYAASDRRNLEFSLIDLK